MCANRIVSGRILGLGHLWIYSELLYSITYEVHPIVHYTHNTEMGHVFQITLVPKYGGIKCG